MAFPQFSRLPFEIRDRIWELSVPPTPHAHFAELEGLKIATPKDTNSVMSMRYPYKHVIKLYRRHAPEGTRGITDVKSILQVTRNSHAFALRHCGYLPRADEIVRLRRGTTSLPEVSINGATDLVILEQGWDTQLVTLRHSRATRGLEEPKRLHYIAVPRTILAKHDHSTEPSNRSLRPRSLKTGIYNLPYTFENLDVVYVLIEPDVLRVASEQPWTETRDWDEDLNGHEISLETYLAAYKEGQTHPRSFWCGWREFYEIPAEQVALLGGLEHVIQSLEGVRAERAEREDARCFNAEGDAEGEPLRFRLMSWRDV